ncbi:MAG: hypothetical protein ACI94Y_000981 [Maribacter sp.]
MEKPISLTTNPILRKGMDYYFLRKEGIRLLQELSGETWTDYNHHDPGVTILEQLCFAFTDLGYRTDFELEDLFRPENNVSNEELPTDTFFDPLDILPTAPLTTNDYRIFIIDRISSVNNAWLEPVLDNLYGIKGLYRVRIHLNESVISDQQASRIKRKVRQLLNQHRNLSEDFESINIIETEEITIRAQVDITPDAIGETILAQMYNQLTNYISPRIKTHSLRELLEKGMALEDIFNGPRPLNGFIQSEDLLPLPTEISTSKIIEILTGIQGVVNVKHLVVYKDGLPASGDIVPIEEKKYPILKLNFEEIEQIGTTQIEMNRGGMKYILDWETTQNFYQSLSLTGGKSAKVSKVHQTSNNFNGITSADIRDYYSVQNHFPSTYGISSAGAPSSATKERKAAIRQLKAYLLLFDQMLANYLEQLANVKQLFSLKKGVDTTYFTQIPTDVSNLEELLVGGNLTDFKGGLEESMSKIDPIYDRKNRFLNHLLARFGEVFSTDSAIRNKHFSGLGGANERDADEKALINAKIDLLQHYPELSAARGRAFDYGQPSWENDNVPSLKKKVAFELGIDQYQNTLLSNIRDLPRSELLIRKRDELTKKNHVLRRPKATGEKGKSFSYYGGDSLEFKEDRALFVSDSENIFSELLAFGQHEKYYGIFENPEEGKEGFILTFVHPLYPKQIKIYEASNRKKVENALKKVVKYFKENNQKGEGFHILEHILLRPLSTTLHGFRLINDLDEVILKSENLQEKEAQNIDINDLLIIGDKDEAYGIETLEEGYGVVIKNAEDVIIARLVHIYETEIIANEAIEETKKYIKSFRVGNVDIFSKIETFTGMKEERLEKTDFHSLRITVVLPNWPIRFQNKEFRSLFEQTLTLNAPAHLSIDFYWIDIDQITVFEKTYRNWLVEKAEQKKDKLYLDELSFELIELIKSW